MLTHRLAWVCSLGISYQNLIKVSVFERQKLRDCYEGEKQ